MTNSRDVLKPLQFSGAIHPFLIHDPIGMCPKPSKKKTSRGQVNEATDRSTIHRQRFTAVGEGSRSTVHGSRSATRKALRPIAVYGAGGFGLEVAMLVEQMNEVDHQWEMVGFFDDGAPTDAMVNDHPVLGGIEELNEWSSELYIALALGIPRTKRAVFDQIANPNVRFATLIHPSVIIGSRKYVDIGQGSIICAGTIVTTNISIGKQVILNLACTVGHETSVGDFSSFMPTCNISGEVRIGEGNFWGTGAKVINRKNIGDNVIVGAGAVVTTDLPDDVTAVGVPAKIIKSVDREG